MHPAYFYKLSTKGKCRTKSDYWEKKFPNKVLTVTEYVSVNSKNMSAVCGPGKNINYSLNENHKMKLLTCRSWISHSSDLC